MLTQLLEELSQNRHRELVIVSGETHWAWQQAENLMSHFDEFLVLSKHHNLGIWPEHNHQLLGQEYPAAIYDYNSGLLPDKFATLAGTIKAGGLLVIVMPKMADFVSFKDNGFDIFQSANFQSAKTSLFNQYIQQRLPELPCLIVEQGKTPKYNRSALNQTKPSISQLELVKRFSHRVIAKGKIPLLISADRGRGKSAALGLIAAELVKQNKRVLICASQRNATMSAFKHFKLSIEDREYEKHFDYIAPDALVSNKPQCDVLLIDEAATLPIPILKTFINNYPRVIFATTIHGYEGTGRGFSLRFIPYLKKHFKHFEQQHLTRPIRFSDGDPLESCINDMLLLNADFKDVRSDPKTPINFSKITQLQLLENHQLLNQVFALLVTAHYQTTANDFRHLLDSNNLAIYIAEQDNELVGTALISLEGSFNEELATQVIAGQRRPRGHLLAQTVGQLSGHISDLAKSYARIMRIAVHPDKRRQSIGSQLIEFAENDLQNIDCIGTSFGAQSDLVEFWQQAQFVPIKLGYKRDKASAEHAMVMIKSADILWQNSLTDRFSQQLDHQLPRAFSELECNIILHSLVTQPVFSIEQDKQEITRFIRGEILFEHVYSALYRNIRITPQTLVELEIISRSLLIRLVLQGQPLESVAYELKINGKKQLQQQLKSAVSTWFDITCLN